LYTNSSKEYLKNKRLFYRILLKSFIEKNKHHIEDSKGNKEKNYLSVAQATSLLSWWKKIGKHLDSNIPIGMIEFDVSTELAIIEAIVRLSHQADLTDSMENCQYAKEKKSALSDADSLLPKPGVELGIELETIDVALDKACKRAIWSTGFSIVEEKLPHEYLAKLVQIVAAQYIHARESEKKMFGLSVEEVGNYLQNIDKIDYTKTIVDALSKTIELPDSPQTALTAAIHFVEQETGDKIGESILITEMCTAFQNLIVYASQVMDKALDSDEFKVAFDNSCAFGRACKKYATWIIEPVILLRKIKDYKVYIPFSINPQKIINNDSLGTKSITDIPSTLSTSPANKLMLSWMSSAIEVNVSAYSHKHAYKNALEKIEILLDSIALLHPNGYVHYQYDLHKYVSECNGDIEVKIFAPKGFIPHVHGESNSILKNIDSILELRKSKYNWIKQLARCSRFIRKAAETQDQETKFLHLWRALEAICGHLTGLQPDIECNANTTTPESRQMSPRNYLVLAVSFASGRIVSKNEKNFWSEFDQQYTSLWSNLRGIMRARSQWVIHTGDERDNSIEEISEDYLESACEFLIDTIIYPVFCFLSAIAIGNPNLKSRAEVYNEVFLGSIERD